ncbi:SART-1 family protein DOT2 isoform X2 [Lotus japonicus]|uniref:SART-1 family protein DOT2 isoform X2 n=1 Tax=Lotus japonicus TaxID=34305 RepID=UPI002588CB7E|nr:SART-1 family protein DOT2 isoform X2 [Lotus japonicus]
MDMEWSESRYEGRNGKDESSPVREPYDDDGVEKSSKHRAKDRKKSDRSKDREPTKEARDVEKDRVGGRERKKEDRDERDKDRGKDGKMREKDYDREKYREKERERDRDKKDRSNREKEREIEKDGERGRDKEREKEKTRDRDKGKEREREKHRDREKERESYRDGDREKDKGKDKIREKEREMDRDKERSRDRVSRKTTHEEDHDLSNVDDKVDYREKRDEDVGKQAKASKLGKDDHDGETSAHLSSAELEERILKMKETRAKKHSEAASEISSWVSKSRKIQKERALQLSKVFEEQDNIAVEGSDDEDTTNHTDNHLAGVKVLHGLDKVVEGGTVVLTIKDQPILADGDINEDVDMLENVEIGEQKRRDEAYKASKKKPGIYEDKFNDDPSVEKKMLPQYDDPTADEGLTLDERGRFTGEAEKKLEELRRRLTGDSSTNNLEDLTSSGKVSSDYYTQEEMLKFKKPKKKKSLRKKDKLDINALEAEAISSGLGVGDLGSRKDASRQAIKDEQERLDAEMRNNAYQSAYAKADEASKLLLLEQTINVKAEEDETPVFADDDEDLRKSLEKARRLALKKQEKEVASGPQAVALLATSNHNNEVVDDQAGADSRENKVVFTEMEEFVWGLHIDEEARKPEGEDVFMHDDEVAEVRDEQKSDEAGGWTEVKEASEDEQTKSEDKEEIVPDETIHEVSVGKGLSGALKLLKDRGSLKESIEWGGRNMDKKKSKLVGIVDDEGKDAQNKKEIRIERTDEFGRILTPKEAFRLISHKFHGKGPGKMKQEKRMKQYHEELRMKQMKSSDTPSLSVERMREAQVRSKTPYIVLSGNVKPGCFVSLHGAFGIGHFGVWTTIQD